MSCKYMTSCPKTSAHCQANDATENCFMGLKRTVEDDKKEISELKKQNDALTRRLNHLLSSKSISRFDEVDPQTHKYKHDINEADNFSPMSTPLWILTVTNRLLGETFEVNVSARTQGEAMLIAFLIFDFDKYKVTPKND